jgi:hypothetical protein
MNVTPTNVTVTNAPREDPTVGLPRPKAARPPTLTSTPRMNRITEADVPTATPLLPNQSTEIKPPRVRFPCGKHSFE